MSEPAPASQGEPPVWLLIGAWTLDVEGDRLLRDGEVVKLEPRLTRLLLCLAQQRGHVVPVTELLAAVWQDVVVTPESVYQGVAALRRALGDDGRHPAYIANVPRKGYRLIAEVRPGVPPAEGAASDGSPAAPVPGETLRPLAPADGAADDGTLASPDHGAPAAAPRAAGMLRDAIRPIDASARRSRQPVASWLARPAPVAAALTALVVAVIGSRLWPSGTGADVPVASVEAGAAAPATAGVRTPPSEATRTVLWVDDKPQNNERERDALAAFGVRFELARTTEEAMAMLAAQRIDLVISDQHRPGDPIAGFTLLSRMRQDRGDRTPFVLYTSACPPEEAMEARALGALACTTQISALMQSALAALEARR